MMLPWHLGKQMTRWYRRICALSLSDVSWVIPFDVGPFPIPGVFAPFYVNSRTNKDIKLQFVFFTYDHESSVMPE